MTASHRPDESLRDPVLDAAWNAHSMELPPPRIDAAILAAAHREAKARPEAVAGDDGVTHARRPAPAWWGLAAAATIGAIAFGVLQLAPSSPQQSEPIVASDVPPAATTAAPKRDDAGGVPAAEGPPPVTAPTSPVDRATMARAEQLPSPAVQGIQAPQRKAAKVARVDPAAPEPGQPASGIASSEGLRDQPAGAEARLQEQAATVTQEARSSSERAAAMTAPPPSQEPRAFPSSPPVVAKRDGAPGAPQSRPDSAKAEGNAFAGRSSPAPERAGGMAASPSEAAMLQRQRSADPQPLANSRPVTPDAWIERIRTLHDQRRLEEAARELNAFRDAFPDADARLPASLAGWAASVRRNVR